MTAVYRVNSAPCYFRSFTYVKNFPLSYNCLCSRNSRSLQFAQRAKIKRGNYLPAYGILYLLIIYLIVLCLSYFLYLRIFNCIYIISPGNPSYLQIQKEDTLYYRTISVVQIFQEKGTGVKCVCIVHAAECSQGNRFSNFFKECLFIFVSTCLNCKTKISKLYTSFNIQNTLLNIQ